MCVLPELICLYPKREKDISTRSCGKQKKKETLKK